MGNFWCCENYPIYHAVTNVYSNLLALSIFPVQDFGNQINAQEVSCTCRTQCHSKKCYLCQASKAFCTERCHLQHTCVNIPMPLTAPTNVIVSTEETTSGVSAESSTWVKCCRVSLTTKHGKMLQSKVEWLDNTIITVAQSLLHKQFPHIGVLQMSTLGAWFAMEPQAEEYLCKSFV